MAIFNIFGTDSLVEVTVASDQPIQNFQQRYMHDTITVKEKMHIHLADTRIIKGTSVVSGITPPLLMNSSSSINAQHELVDTTYIHSNFPTPTTYTSQNKDFQVKPTLTIKIRGSYVSDNAAGGGATGPYWS